MLNIKRKSIFRICLMMAALCLSIILVFTFNMVSRAEDISKEVSYISIQIKEGDTLNKIASRHINNSGLNHTKLVKEITRLNHLSSDQIYAGAYLVIPVIIDEAAID